MNLYAVSLFNFGGYDFGNDWIEFYWADDEPHAREQAIDGNASSEIKSVRMIPESIRRFPEIYGTKVTR